MKKVFVAILIMILCFSAFQFGQAPEYNYSRFSQQSPETGLLGYWKFDEGSGNSVVDSSVGSNNGTNYGGTWVQGKTGYALEFDGIDDYVSIPTFSLPNLTSVSVAAWINSPLTQIGYIFYNGVNGEFLLHNGQRAFDGASGLYPEVASFSVKFASVGWVDVFSNAMTPNSWH